MFDLIYLYQDDQEVTIYESVVTHFLGSLYVQKP